MAGDKLAKYRAAIRENFPGLDLQSLVYLAEGWDSLVCLANDRLIFRFPKRAEVAERLALETRLLPELAPLLPLPIPQFTFISKPKSKRFPYLFVGYEALPGIVQPDLPEKVVQAEWWKSALGNFLTALHNFPVERARQLGVRFMNFPGTHEPQDSWREALESFYSQVREKIYPLLSEARQDEVAAYFEDFLDDGRYFNCEPVLLHADLEENNLVDLPAQKVTGVIDFGNVCLGDPAYDVMQELIPFYKGRIDSTFEKRQLFYKQLGPFIFLIFGLEHSDAALVEYGLGAINSDDFLS